MKISRRQLSWSTVLVILFVQAPHLANEFAAMSQLPSDWLQILHGIIFAIAIDYAVYIFAVQGRVWQTVLFMIASFVITLNYYQDYLVFDDFLIGGTAVMISALGVLSVFFLSHEVKRSSNHEGDSKPKWADERRGLLDKIVELNNKLSDIEKHNDDYKEFFNKTISFSPKDVEVLKARNKEKDLKEISKTTEVPVEEIEQTINKFKTLYQTDKDKK